MDRPGATATPAEAETVVLKTTVSEAMNQRVVADASRYERSVAATIRVALRRYFEAEDAAA